MVCRHPCLLDAEIERLLSLRGLRAFLLGSALAQAGLGFFPYTTSLNWHAIAGAVCAAATLLLHGYIERRWARAMKVCRACEEQHR